jgi:hypothetical protein
MVGRRAPQGIGCTDQTLPKSGQEYPRGRQTQSIRPLVIQRAPSVSPQTDTPPHTSHTPCTPARHATPRTWGPSPWGAHWPATARAVGRWPRNARSRCIGRGRPRAGLCGQWLWVSKQGASASATPNVTGPCQGCSANRLHGERRCAEPPRVKGGGPVDHRKPL